LSAKGNHARTIKELEATCEVEVSVTTKDTTWSFQLEPGVFQEAFVLPDKLQLLMWCPRVALEKKETHDVQKMIFPMWQVCAREVGWDGIELASRRKEGHDVPHFCAGTRSGRLLYRL
jgi:hypothetical protein